MTRRVRTGFTLIELLVVVGIITVLVGLGVLAYVHQQKSAAEGLTKSRLQMCASLLTEYDPSGTLLGVEGVPSGSQTYFYVDTVSSSGVVTYAVVSSPGDVTFGAGNRYLGA